MNPVMNAFHSPASHVLRYLAFVMREHKVHSASVDVKFLAQILLAHHGAFQMPSREALAPR